MSVKDIFERCIKEGQMNKVTLLNMLEKIKSRNTSDVVIITDDEYNAIKARIDQLVS